MRPKPCCGVCGWDDVVTITFKMGTICWDCLSGLVKTVMEETGLHKLQTKEET